MEFLLYVVEYKAELGNSRADPGGWVLGAWGVGGDSKHAHKQTNTQTHKQTHVHTRFRNLGSTPAICMNTATGTDISTKQRQYILRKVQHNIKVSGTMWVYNYIACRDECPTYSLPSVAVQCSVVAVAAGWCHVAFLASRGRACIQGALKDGQNFRFSAPSIGNHRHLARTEEIVGL